MPRNVGPASHVVLNEPGPYVFPDLTGYECVDNLGHVFVLRVLTASNQRIWIPMLHLAARSLLTAPGKEVKFEAPTGVRPIVTIGMTDPVEMPLLSHFVCFRAISPEWRVCEFTNENGQQILVSFSRAAYRAVIKGLKATLARKAVPAAVFTGRKVFLVENMPRHERNLTDQEAVEMAAKTLTYHTGIEPEKFLWVWHQLKGLSWEEERETANRLWAQLGIDPHKAANQDRPKATIEKFHRRLDPEGKVSFSSMRRCAECEGYFGTRNGKKKYCSEACEAAASEKCRPLGYHADFQRRTRAEKRAKAHWESALKERKNSSLKRHRNQRPCGWCSNPIGNHSRELLLACRRKQKALPSKK